MVAKIAATAISMAFGGSGGVFSPLLFIGGMCGYFIGGIAGFWVPLTPSDRVLLSAVGMSTCLGVVVREPLTSLLIVFEMTHQFSFVPGLMVGTIISVIVSHAASRTNFYDSVLLQEGHELMKIRPPLDLMSWQNLPVSAIANPRPVVVGSLSGDHLREVLDNHPYQCFPVSLDGEPIGLITRAQIEAILAGKDVSEIPLAVTSYPDQAVREVGNKFIESPHGCIVVLDRGTGRIAGIITLHDLLRAQASILG
jgi:CIC family chloride channel protein